MEWKIQRCGSASCALDEISHMKRLKAHLVVCDKCGAEYYRSRNSNLTLHPERYHCHCGGSLKLKY